MGNVCSHVVICCFLVVADIMDKSDPAYGPTWISIRSHPTQSVLESYKKLKSKVELTISTEEILHSKGHLSFDVQVDGDVEICIRASTASRKEPLRFGLEVKQNMDAAAELFMDDDVPASNDHHWTHLEEEMRHLLGIMQAIQVEADFSKDREMAFHQQTLSMHAASMWWPIVHVSVLLLTGFTQATHIVRFFKSRRIM